MAKPVKRLGAIELLIFFVGLAVSVAVFFQMKNAEKKQAALAFEAESAERVGHVNRRITDLLYSLKSIQHGQQTMGELSREGFSKLARSGLASSPELEELAYVPIVTSAERADLERGARRDGLEEFRVHDQRGRAVEGGTTRPLLFIEPTPKSTRFGQDLAKDPEFIRVAKKATASGEATALASHRAEDAEGKRTRGTLLAPIYDPDGATFVRVGRLHSIKGHIMATFDVNQLLADALPEHADVTLQIVAGDEHRWLAGAEELTPRQQVFSRTLNYPGETWSLRSTPTPDYFAARATALPYGGALVALVVTLLLAFTFRQQRLQKAKVEAEVELRTIELEQRARDMRRVLDNVDSGLLTIDYDGHMSPEASQIVGHWFGPRSEEENDAIAYLSRFDETTAGYLELGLEQLREDFLPLELNLAQLPTQFSNGKQILHVSYLPFEDDEGQKLLLVMSDVTQRIGAERQQKRQLEVISMFEHIAKDREGFVEFFNDGTRLVTAIVEKTIHDPIVLAREIHTLKGNCGMLGLKSVAEICHEIETQLGECGEASEATHEALQNRWREVTRDLHQFIGGNDDTGVWLSEVDIEHVKDAIRRNERPQRLFEMFDDFRNARLETEFQRLAQRAKQLGKQTGKGNIGIEIEHNEVRLPHAPFKRFWSNLVHVIRNAVDHGLASEEDAGKAPRLRFGSQLYANEVIVEVSDNGRGIDWGRLRSKAAIQGISVEQDEDLLFLDGLSSKDEVSAISGRGVGMAAVKSAVLELGGEVDVETDVGEGTTFRFRFPKNANRQSHIPPRAA